MFVSASGTPSATLLLVGPGVPRPLFPATTGLDASFACFAQLRTLTLD